jgi:hypothetical protein
MNTAQLRQLLDDADPDGEAEVWVLGPDGTWAGALDLLATAASTAYPPPGGGVGITTQGA